MVVLFVNENDFCYYRNCLYSHRYKFSSEKEQVNESQDIVSHPGLGSDPPIGSDWEWSVTLRSGRIPERHIANAELETPYNLRKLDQTKPKRCSRRFSRVVQATGTPKVSSLSRGSYSQPQPLTKK